MDPPCSFVVSTNFSVAKAGGGFNPDAWNVVKLVMVRLSKDTDMIVLFSVTVKNQCTLRSYFHNVPLTRENVDVVLVVGNTFEACGSFIPRGLRQSVHFDCAYVSSMTTLR